MNKRIAVIWDKGPVVGEIGTTNGYIKHCCISQNEGECNGNRFYFSQKHTLRLEIMVESLGEADNFNPAIISINTTENPFSFFLRDVCKMYPIWIPDYGVAVTESEDDRTYGQIKEAIRQQGGLTSLQRMRMEPEEGYENAAIHTRNNPCPTWLGLSRDMRIFAVGFRGTGEEDYKEKMWDWIQPRYHGFPVKFGEKETPLKYFFILGRGISCVHELTRRLEDGVLPILHGKIADGGLYYHTTTFVSLEKSPLNAETLRGTHFLVADGYGIANMMTEEQKRRRDELLVQEMNPAEETVLYYRTEIVNTDSVPRYAWFKSPYPEEITATFDPKLGFGIFEDGRVYCVAKLNGKPLTQEETAILIKPGESVKVDWLLPHSPITIERALELAQQDFAFRHHECSIFWREKLKDGTQMRLPEQRIDEMIRAGLLHLDLISYGLETSGTLTPNVGVYTPIGSESAPIIQFMDSMGWHDVARRSLMYFLDKQHEDGFMQNFNGYMLENGAVLWSIGEHYRYMHDDNWIKSIMPKLLKSYEYILRWRNRNKTESLHGKGFGLLDGKCADPEDAFHSFMLNGYAYLGLSRTAEMLASIDPDQSRIIYKEAQELKCDIRTAFFEGMARSPVVPLGDGTWCPTAPPWAEHQGPVSLFAEGGRWYSHATMFCRDSLVGPMYLVFQEVINPTEPVADFLLNYHCEMMFERNVALSQPYYSRHPWIHLKRNEVKPFLEAYYNGFSGMADRETYTFWEHFHHITAHKTHEEAWFLMQTRWMLYMEEKDNLKVFPGIPREWMENGKSIELKDASSYFGPISVRAESKLDQGYIHVQIICDTDRRPAAVEIRLPHPEGKPAVEVTAGIYDPLSETVKLESFDGRSEILLRFNP